MKRFFITGTDTHCGKTYAICTLLSYLKAKDYRVEALKPVASGCEIENNNPVNSDAKKIQSFSSLTLNEINPWAYTLPVSPHIAAAKAGDRLTARDVSNYCMNKKWRELDYLLIEGAGGLLVPLNENETWLDFLKLSRIPTIIVVAIKLGCINHALLTASVMEKEQVSCVGWIANYMEDARSLVYAAEAVDTLKDKLNIPYFGKISYLGEFSSEKEPLACF